MEAEGLAEGWVPAEHRQQAGPPMAGQTVMRVPARGADSPVPSGVAASTTPAAVRLSPGGTACNAHG